MNVTVYPEAQAWLFAERTADHCCVWSFGRHQPPAEIGHDLLFRFDGWPVGRSIVRAIFAPGELDVPMFDGSRQLTGWKLLWYQSDFEDLRALKLPKVFGKPLSSLMRKQLVVIAQLMPVGGPAGPGLRPLVNRRLVIEREARGAIRSFLTPEGWRAVLRETSPQRQIDIEHDEDSAAYRIGGPVCCICGCTDGHGCDEGCEWASDRMCSRCADLPGVSADYPPYGEAS